MTLECSSRVLIGVVIQYGSLYRGVNSGKVSVVWTVQSSMDLDGKACEDCWELRERGWGSKRNIGRGDIEHFGLWTARHT